ncbi:hypothetical protein PV375_07355 [Gulosibacter sp. GYB002]|uniref:hypothetical protein n=1 Tax=Gulosibacter sp. GYB002 TaxID=2994391 RepID=UPI002F963962
MTINILSVIGYPSGGRAKDSLAQAVPVPVDVAMMNNTSKTETIHATLLLLVTLTTVIYTSPLSLFITVVKIEPCLVNSE